MIAAGLVLVLDGSVFNVAVGPPINSETENQRVNGGDTVGGA